MDKNQGQFRRTVIQVKNIVFKIISIPISARHEPLDVEKSQLDESQRTESTQRDKPIDQVKPRSHWHLNEAEQMSPVQLLDELPARHSGFR